MRLAVFIGEVLGLLLLLAGIIALILWRYQVIDLLERWWEKFPDMSMFAPMAAFFFIYGLWKHAWVGIVAGVVLGLVEYGFHWVAKDFDPERKQ